MGEICGKSIFRAIAAPPIIPPSWTILKRVNKKVVQTAQFFGPDKVENEAINGLPVIMAFFPNSSWIATFTKQLTRITQNVINPPSAPSTVVAINSPEPTIEAERINPGPRNLSFSKSEVGGFFISGDVML